jgi:hypothetical protein
MDLNYLDRSNFDTDVAALDADALVRPLMRFMWIFGAGRLGQELRIRYLSIVAGRDLSDLDSKRPGTSIAICSDLSSASGRSAGLSPSRPYSAQNTDSTFVSALAT